MKSKNQKQEAESRKKWVIFRKNSKVLHICKKNSTFAPKLAKKYFYVLHF